MRWLLVALMVWFQTPTVDLGPDFGEADARVSRVNAERVQLSLSVRTFPGGSVVAHLIDPGGLQETIALAEAEDGRYEGYVETRPVDYVVVFEAITAGQESVQSNPVRITQIGVASSSLVIPVVGLDEADDPFRWVWLAMGAGTLAMALVALAYLPKKREEAQAESEPATVSS